MCCMNREAPAPIHRCPDKAERERGEVRDERRALGLPLICGAAYRRGAVKSRVTESNRPDQPVPALILEIDL